MDSFLYQVIFLDCLCIADKLFPQAVAKNSANTDNPTTNDYTGLVTSPDKGARLNVLRSIFTRAVVVECNALAISLDEKATAYSAASLTTHNRAVTVECTALVSSLKTA